MDVAWYQQLRDRYRPERLEVLLVGESPPDPLAGPERFFYSPALARADNLYRGVAQAVYGEEADFDVRRKAAVLDRLRDDGYWLIDAVQHPINKVGTAERRRAIREGAPELIERIVVLAPRRGVIICHGQVFQAVAAELRGARVPLLHDIALPFPLGNHRAVFVARMREALQRD